MSCLAETSAAFCRKSTEETYSRGVKFERETWQAMSRVHARNSALRIADEGIKLILGYGSGSASDLAMENRVTDIMNGQAGTVSDMDLIAEKLKEVFKKT